MAHGSGCMVHFWRGTAAVAICREALCVICHAAAPQGKEFAEEYAVDGSQLNLARTDNAEFRRILLLLRNLHACG